MGLVDSHCHLDGPRFTEDREAVIGRALEAGVERMLSIGSGDGPPDLEAAIRIAERYAPVWATVGVHRMTPKRPPKRRFANWRPCCGIPRLWAWVKSGSTIITTIPRATRSAPCFAISLPWRARPACL